MSRGGRAEVGEVEPALRAGEGDIEEPLVFFARLSEDARFDLRGQGRQPRFTKACAALFAVGDLRMTRVRVAATREAACQEDDRRLEPLGLVHGEELHCVPVALDPLHAPASHGLGAAIDERLEQRDEIAYPAVSAALLEEDLDQMLVVGQRPRAAWTMQEPAHQPGLVEQGPQQRGVVALRASLPLLERQ